MEATVPYERIVMYTLPLVDKCIFQCLLYKLMGAVQANNPTKIILWPNCLDIIFRFSADIYCMPSAISVEGPDWVP